MDTKKHAEPTVQCRIAHVTQGKIKASYFILKNQTNFPRVSSA